MEIIIRDKEKTLTYQVECNKSRKSFYQSYVKSKEKYNLDPKNNGKDRNEVTSKLGIRGNDIAITLEFSKLSCPDLKWDTPELVEYREGIKEIVKDLMNEQINI